MMCSGGHAFSASLTLVTANTAEFSRVPGLNLEKLATDGHMNLSRIQGQHSGQVPKLDVLHKLRRERFKNGAAGDARRFAQFARTPRRRCLADNLLLGRPHSPDCKCLADSPAADAKPTQTKRTNRGADTHVGQPRRHTRSRIGFRRRIPQFLPSSTG